MSLLNQIARKLGDFEQRGDEYSFECPRCANGKKKLGVNLKQAVFNCFRCHFGGQLSDLLLELNIHWEEELSRVSPAAKTKSIRPLPQEIENFVRFHNNPSFDTDSLGYFLMDAYSYAKKRGRLNPQDLYDLGWGFAARGALACRLIVPIKMEGKLVSYLARSIYDFLEPKELAGPEHQGWWPRNRLGWPYDLMVTGRPLVLVEGIWDQIAVAQVFPKINVLSTLGAHLSDEICGRILSLKPTGITIFYDGDKAGEEGTESAIKKLVARKYVDIGVARPSEGSDPDELSPRTIQKKLAEAVKWSTYTMGGPSTQRDPDTLNDDEEYTP